MLLCCLLTHIFSISLHHFHVCTYVLTSNKFIYKNIRWEGSTIASTLVYFIATNERRRRYFVVFFPVCVCVYVNTCIQCLSSLFVNVGMINKMFIVKLIILLVFQNKTFDSFICVSYKYKCVKNLFFSWKFNGMTSTPTVSYNNFVSYLNTSILLSFPH